MSTISLDLDSLPGRGRLAPADSLARSGLQPKVSEQTIARVLPLPSSIDEYYTMIGKKERHELRRKRRRYEEQVGPATLCTDQGPDSALMSSCGFIGLLPATRGRS